MFLLTIATAWTYNGEISTSIEKQLLFSTEQKVTDYLLTVGKKKNRSITITKFFVDLDKPAETIRDEWWCE